MKRKELAIWIVVVLVCTMVGLYGYHRGKLAAHQEEWDQAFCEERLDLCQQGFDLALGAATECLRARRPARLPDPSGCVLVRGRWLCP